MVTFNDAPIRKKLILVTMLTSGAVLMITCSAYFIYEFVTFRQATVQQLSTLARVVATNSTAALAFDSPEDATEILGALKAESHIVEAGIYNKEGALFSFYPADITVLARLPDHHEPGYKIKDSFIIGYEPILEGTRSMGTLFIKSDMKALNQRLQLYGGIALAVITISFFAAYLLSNQLQKLISKPILGLADTARAVSERGDYSLRAKKWSNDELGALTDSFNHMLHQIEVQRKEIKSFNQELEKKILERTFELEAANKEMESFSYTVSHDLRAPLRAVIGFSNMLLEDYENKLEADGIRLIKTIQSNGKKMGQLVDDLLEFSRMGKRELNVVNADLDKVVKEVIQEHYNSNDKLNVDIKVNPIGHVRADASLMYHVFQNLIGNAIKYSSKATQPEVQVGVIKQNGNKIYFIKDNGAGFDMKYYDKLFGVFQRLHRQEEFDGTGVGLAIAHRIVSRHKGRIWAEGVVNAGATFYFTLNDKSFNAQEQ